MLALPAVAIAAALGGAPDASAGGAAGDASAVIGGVITGAMSRGPTADISDENGAGLNPDVSPDADAGPNPDVSPDADDAASQDLASQGVASQGARSEPGESAFTVPQIMNAVKNMLLDKGAERPLRILTVICSLCLFTSSLSLFVGYTLKRQESADILLVTLGIVMVVAGGTVIPYPYMPDIFMQFKPFCFNSWAQAAIASALFGDGVFTDNAPLAGFAALAVLLLSLTVIRVRKARVF